MLLLLLWLLLPRDDSSASLEELILTAVAIAVVVVVVVAGTTVLLSWLLSLPVVLALCRELFVRRPDKPVLCGLVESVWMEGGSVIFRKDDSLITSSFHDGSSTNFTSQRFSLILSTSIPTAFVPSFVVCNENDSVSTERERERSG